MASTINADDGIVSGSAGVKTSADNSGVLELQSNGNTQFTLGSSSVVINEAGADVDFRVESDTNDHALFVQGSDGNVGIGTSSPAYKLDVRGSTDTSYLNITSTADANGTTLRIGTDATAAFINATGGSSGTLQLRTYGTTKATLDPSGNLGLGVTPSAWGSSIKALEGFTTNSTWSIAAGGGLGDALNIQNNAYYDGSNWIYKASATATNYYQNLGAHVWRIAGSGTAGGTISWTQAMTLDASGNLGVGTTTPGTRLHVTGSNGFFAQFLNSTNNSGEGVVLGSGSGLGRISSNGASTALTLEINGTESARIDTSGNLLVGTTSSAASSGVGIKIRPGQSAGISEVSDFSTNAAGDSLDLYSTVAGYRFYVGWGGTVYATNTTISAISDQRLKENIRDLDVGLDAVLALKPRKFDWKEGKGKDKKDDRGFIAQEFEQVFPDLIDTWKDPAPEGEEPYKAVRADLIPVLVKAIQEQQTMIEDLKAKVAALESK